MKTLYILLLVGASNFAFGQKYISNKSTTTFFSSALLEDITATSTEGKGAIDRTNGQVAFSIPIRSFRFAKALMQEHFNERYMESDKYPKASFTGTVVGWKDKRSNNTAIANGKLTIHGITREVSVPGSVVFEKDILKLHAKFMVKLVDYGIEIPSLMFQKIAEEVEVTIDYEYPTNDK